MVKVAEGAAQGRKSGFPPGMSGPSGSEADLRDEAQGCEALSETQGFVGGAEGELGRQGQEQIWMC